MNYKDIDLEFEIIGELPGGRYEQSAVMNYRYLDEALRDVQQGQSKDQQHPMTEKTLALMWLRVPDTPTFERVAEQVMSSPEYKSPAVKCETASSGIASFLDAYKDLLFGMRWLLVPAILVTMALVIANAISISVRERRMEMAVLKVLGFSPNQILILVLGEALLIGCVSGVFSAWVTEIPDQRADRRHRAADRVLRQVLCRRRRAVVGPASVPRPPLAGSLLPAWSARSVKVSEVFSKIA